MTAVSWEKWKKLVPKLDCCASFISHCRFSIWRKSFFKRSIWFIIIIYKFIVSSFCSSSLLDCKTVGYPKIRTVLQSTSLFVLLLMLRSWLDLSRAIVNTDQCEQRFISGVAFNIYEVIASLSGSWLGKQTHGFFYAFPLARRGFSAAKSQEPAVS